MHICIRVVVAARAFVLLTRKAGFFGPSPFAQERGRGGHLRGGRGGRGGRGASQWSIEGRGGMRHEPAKWGHDRFESLERRGLHSHSQGPPSLEGLLPGVDDENQVSFL